MMSYNDPPSRVQVSNSSAGTSGRWNPEGPGNGIEKDLIYYHRAYRKLANHSFTYIILTVLVLAILVTMVMVFHPQITLIISTISRDVLSLTVPGELVEVVGKPYLVDDVYLVTLPGRYPSIRLSIIVAIVSLTFFFVSISVKQVIDPKLVWLIFLSFINLFAALYFIFFAGYFPYDMEIFSEMYMKTEVGIWVLIPFILTVALLPLRINLFKKSGVILLTLLYSIVFACIRYMAFLYLLRATTYLFMAMMFFMLGPFLDFTYIVGSYSLCVKNTGNKTGEEQSQWNWLY
ncbi:MAG: hypothetical protein GY940_40705 [bacterium]|nr:hypothetical protein [bacterium]